VLFAVIIAGIGVYVVVRGVMKLVG
jgi:hypothetical protein